MNKSQKVAEKGVAIFNTIMILAVIAICAYGAHLNHLRDIAPV